MANWYGTSRSNYFLVKDKAAFIAEAKAKQIPFWDDREDGRVGIYGDGGDDGNWPSAYFDDEHDEGVEFDIEDFVVAHLAEGEVAILMQCGAEKLRYVTGYAAALHADGRRIGINITDIYDLVRKEFAVDPILAEY